MWENCNIRLLIGWRNECRLCSTVNGCVCGHSQMRTRCPLCQKTSTCHHGLQKSACDVCNVEPVVLCDAQAALCAANDTVDRMQPTPQAIPSVLSQKPASASTVRETRGPRGSKFCAHGRVKHNCRLCGGKNICEHSNIRHRCKMCLGSCVCPHGRHR